MTARAVARLGLTGLLLGLGTWLAPGAAAATGNISNVEVSPDQIQLVFDTDDTTGPVASDSVQLTLNGSPLETTAEPVGGSGAASIERTTMLVMDTSGSMNQNGRLAAAKQAARAFVSSVPADLRVGLATFDNRARVVEPPSTDRTRLASAIDGLTADGSTAIFDAVVLGARVLGSSGVRSIVLLTDGEEEGSRANLGEATGALRAGKIRLDAVAFQTSAGRETLSRLATAGGGQVINSASAEQLTAQFQAAAERISRQLLVQAALPPDSPTGQVTLTVSGDADGTTVSDTVVALIAAPSETPTIDAAPKPSELAPAPLLSNWLIWAAIALFFLGICGVLAFAFNAAVPTAKSGVSKQLSVYTLAGRTREKKRESTAFGDSSIAQSAVDFAGRVVATRGFEERLQRRLDAGAVPLKPAEWILIQAALVLFLPLIGFFFSGRNIMITIMAAAFALAAPFMFLVIKESRRRKTFVDALPDTLQLMAGSLSAGYSLPQACDSVVREGRDPIATEFNRSLVETRLGVPIEDALEGIADRMRSRDWAWVVMAIRVQREVGGNLAE
ncbi:MAG TPA: VWA domain-containing protein, partial [Nocardioidaceae bacterium]|nr:VWA domain-containing protein [Nocardioidaceae bacterium]